MKNSIIIDRILFKRGSGSVWGNQLHFDVCRHKIIRTEFIVKGELIIKENLDISESEWQQICTHLHKLLPLLKKERQSFIKRLLNRRFKIDGGGTFRKLAVFDDKGNRKDYAWVCYDEAAALEKLFEKTAKEK